MATATAQTTVDEFFPTPKPVIATMIAPVRTRIEDPTQVILEPSAGKGDILDYVGTVTKSRIHHRVYAIEINPELQMVLIGKNYTVIGADFLQFDEPYHFDVVLMNPPFSDGVKHALKAWDVVAAGGVVVCLLNAETVRNPYTHERQRLAQIVKQYGRAEDLGPCFAEAERPTHVDVVMIVLNKPELDRADVLGDLGFEAEAPHKEATFTANPIAHADMFRALVNQYHAAAELLRQRYELGQKLAFYIDGVKGDYASPNFEKLPSLNEQLTELKHMFWSYVFDRTKLASITTSSVREDFERRRKAQQNIAFTYDNIMLVLEALRQNLDTIIQQCIIEAFDRATRYHEKNKEHHEGWTSNKSWMIAKKIIVPYGVEYEQRWGDYWSLRHYKAQEFNDLDKACCFLSGRKFDNITSVSAAINHHLQGVRNGQPYDVKFDSTFFTIKVHKKGTVHLWWKDEALRAQFNQAAAKGKGWVGPGY
jgi:hypothetical protein